jgi:hypothetical protein
MTMRDIHQIISSCAAYPVDHVMRYDLGMLCQSVMQKAFFGLVRVGSNYRRTSAVQYLQATNKVNDPVT